MNRVDIPAECIKPCGTCRQPVVWTRTDRGAHHLVEPDPAPNGSLRLSVAGKAIRSHVVPAKLAFGRTDLHLSHFVKCAHANHWRKRRKGLPS